MIGHRQVRTFGLLDERASVQCACGWTAWFFGRDCIAQRDAAWDAHINGRTDPMFGTVLDG